MQLIILVYRKKIKILVKKCFFFNNISFNKETSAKIRENVDLVFEEAIRACLKSEPKRFCRVCPIL